MWTVLNQWASLWDQSIRLCGIAAFSRRGFNLPLIPFHHVAPAQYSVSNHLVHVFRPSKDHSIPSFRISTLLLPSSNGVCLAWSPSTSRDRKTPRRMTMRAQTHRSWSLWGVIFLRYWDVEFISDQGKCASGGWWTESCGRRARAGCGRLSWFA